MSNLIEKLFGKRKPVPVREADKGIHILPTVSREIYPTWNMKSGVEAYQENPWVYAAVRAIVTEVARSKIRLYRVDKKETIEIEEHPAIKLLEHPNEYQSFYELLEALQTWMELTGESALYVNRLKNGTPIELFVLDPRFLTVIGDPKKYITGFHYRPNNGQAIEMTPEEVILLKEYNPLNEYRGHAPIQSARWSVDSDRYAEEYNAKFFQNDATPRSVITLPGVLKDTQLTRFKETWNTLFKGRSNANKTAVLEGGADIKAIQATNKDMDFAVLGDKNRDRILTAFRVPKTILGIDLDVNRASADAMINIFQRNTIQPKLRSIQEKLNNELLPLFGAVGLEFEFDDPVTVSELDKLRRYTYLFRVGAISPNEIRDDEGLPPVDGGEEPYLPGGYVPIAMAEEISEADPSLMDVDTPSENDSDASDGNDSEPMEKTAKRSITSEKRELLRTQRTNKLKRREVKYARTARKLFGEQERVTLANYLEGERAVEKREKRVEDFFDRGDNIQLTIGYFEGLNLESIEIGGGDALDLVNATTEFDIPRARVAAKNMTIEFAKKITATTEKQLREVIEKAIEAGDGPDVVARELRDVFKGAKTSRTKLIARTETAKAYNIGQLEAMKQVNIKTKAWLTARDEKVRPSHVDAESEGTISINEMFSNGLHYPGDPSGGAGEIVNCRCTLISDETL